MLLIFAQGFFGVFPWNLLAYWAFRYLETERAYDTGQATFTMAIAVVVLAVGNFVGGALGDFAFNRTRRGRLIVSAKGAILGAMFLWLALTVPVGTESRFLLFWLLTAFFMTLLPANIPATVHDITEPEVRSTALAISSFIENTGAATAPFLAGLIAVRSSLADAFLLIGIGAWVVCAILLGIAAYSVPKDIESLRQLMRDRADEARELQTPAQSVLSSVLQQLVPGATDALSGQGRGVLHGWWESDHCRQHVLDMHLCHVAEPHALLQV